MAGLPLPASMQAPLTQLQADIAAALLAGGGLVADVPNADVVIVDDDIVALGIAAAARMPVTKIFGLQAAGFNSGQDDIENYNSVIESQHRANARKIMLEVIPMAARQVFGYDPKIDFEFKALRMLGALDEETMKSSKFNRYHALYADGLYTPKEFLEKLRREGLEDMDTEVSKGSREPEPPQPAFSVATPQEPLKPTKKSEE